jgi:hypothetical protein
MEALCALVDAFTFPQNYTIDLRDGELYISPKEPE